LVIMTHGWPQCWYLWRHMIDPVVAAGYRVAVPDMRGFGASSCPPNVDDYNIRKLTADVAGIATALGEENFISIGHDWGCLVAWYTALSYPQRCKAVLGLSVPFWRIGADTVNPPGKDDALWYIRYFIENPGTAEAELEADLERTLLGIHYAVSAEGGQMAFFKQLELPKTAKLLEAFPVPDKLPGFMTREDLDYYVEEYRTSGFRGSLNWYRNMPTMASSTPELQTKNISQPAAFVCGAEDPTLMFDPEWRKTFVPSFDDLRFIELIDGAGHWVQVEKPKQTAEQILRFLKSVRDNPQ
jgi:pimeloyl-ACP methyl ester carboxylesterase